MLTWEGVAETVWELVASALLPSRGSCRIIHLHAGKGWGPFSRQGKTECLASLGQWHTCGQQNFPADRPLGHCSHAGYSGPQLSQPPSLQKWTIVASPSRQEVQGSSSGNSDQPKKKDLKIMTLELSLLNSPLRSRYSEDRIDRLHSQHSELPNTI